MAIIVVMTVAVPRGYIRDVFLFLMIIVVVKYAGFTTKVYFYCIFVTGLLSWWRKLSLSLDEIVIIIVGGLRRVKHYNIIYLIFDCETSKCIMKNKSDNQSVKYKFFIMIRLLDKTFLLFASYLSSSITIFFLSFFF